MMNRNANLLSLAFLLILNFNSYSQVNVAVGKPVTVDSETSTNPAWKAVEGLNHSNSNRWVSDNQDYPHWIAVNLEKEYNVEKVIFYVGEYGTNHPVYKYDIQYWTGSAWTDIVSRSDNTSPEVVEEFDPVLTSRIRLYAHSGEGSSLMLYEIEIYASFNQKPGIDAIGDPAPVYFDEGEQTIELTGINSGDVENQNLTISAHSSDPGVLADPLVTYLQGDSTAVLTWSPSGSEGTSLVSVKVKDDGGNLAGGTDSTIVDFLVKVRDPAKNYAPTIDAVADVYSFSNSEFNKVILKNISDGDSNKAQSLSIQAREVDKTGILEELTVDYQNENQTALLHFNTTDLSGSETIVVVVRDDGGTAIGGADSTVISFKVISTDIEEAVSVSIDLSDEQQLIEGFGGFGYEKVSWARAPYYSQKFIDDIIDDLGATIIRVSIETYIEPSNDNDDPYDLDMDVFRENFLKNGQNSFIPYIADVNKKAQIKVIASAWTPPAWMKTNNSEIEGGHLRPEYYEEYAEYIVAYIKLMKEQAGVDLYAVSLQNEPTFREPYESCQYTPRTYCDLIRVVGKRFEEENIKTKLFYPEEVFVRDYDIYPWLDTLNNDTVARKYVDIMALHGYDNSGVTAGAIGNDLWERYRNELANHPAHPKQIWMTETSGQPNTIEGALRMGAGISNAIKYGKLNAWVFWTFSAEVTDPENPEHVYNLMFIGHKLKKYYVSKQFYRYVRPGARSVGIESDDIDILSNAFIHKSDKTLTYVLINRSTSEKVLYFSDLKLDPDARIYRTSETENCVPVPLSGTSGLMIPGKSIITIVQSTEGMLLPPTLNQVSDTLLFTSTDPLVHIPLKGISDGINEGAPSLHFEVESSNANLIRDSTVVFDPQKGSADLVLLKNNDMNGESIISISIIRDPVNINDTVYLSRTVSFKATLIDYINNPPYFIISERNTIYLLDGQQSLDIASISGNNPEINEELTFTVLNGNNHYYSVDNIVYTQGQESAILNVTPKKAGSATVSILLTDSGENTYGSNAYQTNVNIRVKEGSTGILNFEESETKAFPIPANSEVNIINTSAYNSLQLFNSSGVLLKQLKIDGEQLTFNTDNLPDGSYFIELSDEKKTRKNIFQILVFHQ